MPFEIPKNKKKLKKIIIIKLITKRKLVKGKKEIKLKIKKKKKEEKQCYAISKSNQICCCCCIESTCEGSGGAWADFRRLKRDLHRRRLARRRNTNHRFHER